MKLAVEYTIENWKNRLKDRTQLILFGSPDMIFGSPWDRIVEFGKSLPCPDDERLVKIEIVNRS